MKASDLFIQCLENEGVQYIFGIPGEENLDLLESIRKSKIQLVLTRHEQGAGFMAATYARLTGKIGVCLSTLGPGATNFVTCCSYAFLGGMPVLFLTGQKPIKKSKQGRFQILDIVRMMEPITKYTKQIVDANNIASNIRDACRIALEEKPGPSHLELPEDIASEKTDMTPFQITFPDYPVPNRKTIEKAKKIIEKAKRPLLLIASGANRKQVTLPLKKFVEKTGIYFFNTQMGKGALNETSPHFLGTAALSDDDYIHWAIHRADLIINVGHDVVEKPPFFMTKEDNLQVIHIHFSKANIDNVYFPQHEVLGDIAYSLEQLTETIQISPHWDFSYFKKIKKEVDTHIYDKSQSDKFPNIPQRIVNDVQQALEPNAIISLDNGMYKIWFARNFKAHQPNTLLLDNALATMGAGLPAGIAAKMVYPQKQVISICGDGGFMMNSQEMETALRLKLKGFVVLVLRDDSYGMIKWKQTSSHFPSFGLDFKNPDFIVYAKSYGATCIRIEKSGQLGPAIQKGFQSSGVCLIEVPIDYSENEKVFIEELKNKTHIL